MKKNIKWIFLSLIIAVSILIPIWAQQQIFGLTKIEKAIEDSNYTAAANMLKNDVPVWVAKNNWDTVIQYYASQAMTVKSLHSLQPAIKTLDSINNTIKTGGAKNYQLAKAYLNTGIFCDENEALKPAITYLDQALLYAQKAEQDKTDLLAKVEYNLGVAHLHNGNMENAAAHHFKALSYLQNNKEANQEDLFLCYRAVGSMYWSQLKLDSAMHNYQLALKALSQSPQTALNRYLRIAEVTNGITGILQEKGQKEEALKSAFEAIKNYQLFLDTDSFKVHQKKARERLYAAYDNLSTIYDKNRDYKRSIAIKQFSYEQKKKHLGLNSVGACISELLLGQSYNNSYQFDKSMPLLQHALSVLEKIDGDYTFWKADGYYALALNLDNQKQIKAAAEAYEKAEVLYDEAYGSSFDNIRTDFINNKSLFLAVNGEYAKSLLTHRKIYKYLSGLQEENYLQFYHYYINLSAINFYGKKYTESISNADKALVSARKMFKQNNALDSIKWQHLIPNVTFQKARAKYALQQNKDTSFLKQIMEELQGGIDVIEQFKLSISDPDNVSILIKDQENILQFYSKIALELYKKTKHTGYLEQFINSKEGLVYGKIRSRLDAEIAIKYSGVPKHILEEEQKLKSAITTSLNVDTGKHNNLNQQYELAQKNWFNFLEQLKSNQPAYYQMRYAKIYQKLPSILKLVPKGSTVVRYYNLDSSFAVLIANNKEQQIVELPNKDLKSKIETLNNLNLAADAQLSLLKEVYDIIWKPIENLVQTQKVMVIPDATLYNINIELLTPTLQKDYTALAQHSLIAKHTFSQHYSLWALQNTIKDDEPKSTYIAFAPVFSDHLKNDYTSKIKDSFELDKNYLMLLPQPNSKRLVQKLSNILGGTTFTENNSTAQQFKQNAGGHKIIHLATHAEFNNSNPDQSGLYFAKKNTDTSDSNFFTLKEIYGANMTSQLTILTACESGKPGYEDGEGLVSLSHAFNYAGSQNILTSIWKIDENTSAQITEYFVDALQQGLATDEALRVAKLKYLQQAEGRLLAPAYWSALVLMGEPIVLQLESSFLKQNWWWLMLLLLVLAGIAFFIWKKK